MPELNLIHSGALGSSSSIELSMSVMNIKHIIKSLHNNKQKCHNDSYLAHLSKSCWDGKINMSTNGPPPPTCICFHALSSL